MSKRSLIVGALSVVLILTILAFRFGQSRLGLPLVDTRWIDWTLLLLGYAVCSGANVAYFSFSDRRLRSMVQRGIDAPHSAAAAKDAQRAKALLRHLEHPNWTLAAILLANVAFGVRLSQLSETLFAGVLAVVMPVICITIFGEFFAQATFLRYAGPICYAFSPFVWLLKWVTAPVSYPLARAVDALYGKEAVGRLKEQELLSDLRLELTEFGRSPQGPHAEFLDPRELKVLMNAAQADDEPASQVGEKLDEETVIPMAFDEQRPVFPKDLVQFVRQRLEKAPHPWFVITDKRTGEPRMILDADGFVRDVFRAASGEQPEDLHPHDHTFRALVYRSADTKLGQVVSDFLVHQEHPGDDVIDVDVAIIWADSGRWIVTGGDILGRLLRGVARRRHWRFQREDRRSDSAKTSAT